MDDYSFDRALVHKRNLHCIFSFNKRKNITFTNSLVLFSALEQIVAFVAVVVFSFFINDAAIRSSNLIIFKSLSFQIK